MGSSGVGKSAFIRRFKWCTFDEESNDLVSAAASSTQRNTIARFPCAITKCSVLLEWPSRKKKSAKNMVDIVDLCFLDVPAMEHFPADSLEEWDFDRNARIRSADAFVILYDVANCSSFNYVKFVLPEIIEVSACNFSGTMC